MNAIVPGPEVVQVALVDPTTAVAPVPEPPQQAPPEAPPEIKPEQDEGVKIAPERPRPKKKEEKREPAKRPEPQSVAAPTLPSAKVGSAGLSGDAKRSLSNTSIRWSLRLPA